MKNIKKSAFGVLSLSAMLLALASCDASRNTNTPTGNINLNQTYASVNTSSSNLSVTYEEVYNKFRSLGYSQVLEQLKKSVVKTEMAAATYEANYKLYNTKFLNAIYGTSDFSSFENLLDSEKETLEDTVDSFKRTEANSYGVEFTDGEISALKALISTFATYKADDLETALPFPDTVIAKLVNQYSYSVALTNYSLKYVETNYDKKYVYSYDDKKEVTNNYRITDENILSSYKSTYYKYNQTKAIIVRFKTEAEADAYVEKTNALCGYSYSNDLDDDKKLNWYVNLYNAYYVNKDALDLSNPFAPENEENTVFYYDNNHKQLTDNYSSDLETFIRENLEDKQGIVSPRKIGSSYCLAYRDVVNYYYGDGTSSDFDNAKNITEADLEAKFAGSEVDYYKMKNYKGKTSTNLNEYIKENLIYSKASESLGDSLVTNQIKFNSTVEIYDPVFENQFYNTFSDYYSFTKNFDNNLIFKITTKFDNHTPGDTSDDYDLGERTYSVEEFFNYEEKIKGNEAATSLIENKYVLASDLNDLLLNSEKESFTNQAKNTISSFNKNKTAYSKKMGLNNYIALTYGLTTHGNEQDALNDYFKAESLKTKFNTYYGYFLSETTDENQSNFVDDGNLFATLKKYADKTKDNAYTFSANHIIIQVCPDVLGTTEDPRKYRAKLSAEEQVKFDKAVDTLTKLIVAEAKVITDKSVDALAKLVTTFNNIGRTYTLQANEYGYTTWEDFKNAYPEFSFYLHSEDLGSITKSSAESYVQEFKDYCAALADKLASNATLAEKVNDEGVLIDPTNDAYKDLGYCLTQYGYHILNVYSFTANDSCKFTSSDDAQQSTSSYLRWQHQAITISEKDPDDTSDDIIVYAAGYSDTDYASAIQLFMYFFKSIKSSSVDVLKPSVNTAVKTYFEDVMTRYTNASFQSYRLLQQVLGYENYSDGNFTSIKFYNNDGSENTTKNANYKNYVTSVRTSIDANKELKEDSTYYGWFEENWTTDLSNCNKYYYNED